MFQHRVSFKAPNRPRNRKNSKFERCRQALKGDEVVAMEAAELALLAKRENRVWALKPFASDFCRTSYDQRKAEGESRYSSEYGSSVKRFKTQQSERLNHKQKTDLTRRELRRSIEKIINGEFSLTGDFNTSIEGQTTRKTYHEMLIDDQITEIQKAKEDQRALKSRITQRFAVKYPERVKTALGADDYIDKEFSKSQNRIQFPCFQPQVTHPETSKRNTYFYSKSKKRCLMERYQPLQRPDQQKQVQAAVSFIEYLSDDRVRKYLQKRSSKKDQCLNLIRRKNNILKIEKPGTKKQQILKECLDDILMNNILR